MSSNNGYSQRMSSDQPVEDCRDYLRTGRCKYGASCKFRHPPNVQSGGGMKQPMDPSEPMFPLRPNEPICQYYMKHGTCKFGQACKFHHPPQTSTVATAAVLTGGNTVVLNGDTATIPQQILLNSVDSSSTMMVQFLPQRPDEPDCIYFLRNGRCKYGATCRYHHPIDYHQGRQGKAFETVRMAPVQIQLPAQVSSNGTVLTRQLVDGVGPQTVQYITTTSAPQQSTSSIRGQHRIVTQKPAASHVLVSTESPIRSTSNPQYIQVTQDGVGVEYQAPVGEPLSGAIGERVSSSSSIASSFETASSSYEGLCRPVGDGGLPASQWSRSMRSASGGNLMSYSTATGSRETRSSQTGFRSSSSEANLMARNSRHRTASFGSVGDSSEASQVYHDASSVGGNSLGWSGTAQSLPTHVERRFIEEAREGSRVSDFRHGYGRVEELSHQESYSQSSHLQGARKLPSSSTRNPLSARQQQQPRQGEAVDQGLSMMTSALLNMLDTTPEEGGMGLNPVSRETSSSTLHLASPPATPRSANHLPNKNPVTLDEQLMPPSAASYATSATHDPRLARVYPAPGSEELRYGTKMHSTLGSDQVYSQPSYSNANSQGRSVIYADESNLTDAHWSPRWQQQELGSAHHSSSLMTAANRDHHLQHNYTAHHSPGRNPSPHQDSSDVGLYLP